VVCLALIAGLILKFGKYEKLAKKSYAVTVIFSDVVWHRLGTPMCCTAAFPLAGGQHHARSGGSAQGQRPTEPRSNGGRSAKTANSSSTNPGLLGDRYIDVTPQSATAEFLKPETPSMGRRAMDLTRRRFMGSVDVTASSRGTIERLDKTSNASTRRCEHPEPGAYRRIVGQH